MTKRHSVDGRKMPMERRIKECLKEQEELSKDVNIICIEVTINISILIIKRYDLKGSFTIFS